jgi:CHAD domain-containing protein
MNAEMILLDAVNARWQKYRSELKTCRAEFSSEAVHDLRVAVRRLLAIFDMLRSVIRHPRIQKIRRELKDQMDQLDELRDVQVLLADISEFVREIPELTPFYEYSQKREGKLLRTARKQIKSLKTGSLSERVEKVRDMVELLPQQNLKENLLETVDDAYIRVMQYYAMIDVEKPATIHRLRIAFKKFRYMIEIIHPLLEGFPEVNFKKMHDYQGMMGNIQDMEASLQQLSDFADSKSAANHEIIQDHYTERLKQSLFNYLDDKGELLTFWRAAPDKSFPWEN